MPTPALGPAGVDASLSRRPGAPGPAGFEGVVPSRITGALKFIFGMFGGAWKFDGKPLEEVLDQEPMTCPEARHWHRGRS